MKKILFVALLFNIYYLFAQVTPTEKNALIALYNATDGANWIDNTNWNTTAPVSTWYGITVENIAGQDHVTAINLRYNEMSGAIPSAITNLINLTSLNLTSNKLSGIIPNLSSLPLSKLYIDKNNFEFGDFENEFSSYQNITDFSYSPMNTVETEITNDMVLGANYNYNIPLISGTGVTYQWYKNDEIITGETALTLSITNAQITDAADYTCKASSTIITDLVIERSTIHLYGTVLASDKNALIVLYNATNGDNWTYNWNWNTATPVHNWHGVEMRGNRVKSIDLSSNNLVGTLPVEIGNLTALEILKLDHNQISGNIPIEVGNLTRLEILDLWSNQLTGSIPSEIGNLTHLTFLHFWKNNLTGTIPSEIGNCTNLTTIGIEDNQLSGTIPASFSNLTAMQSFWVNGNQLSGDISNIFSNWTALKYFSIGNGNDVPGAHNDFTGSVDLSSTNALRICWVDNTLISSLNIKNGNNTNIINSGNYLFKANNNPNLTCIEVDDVAYSTANWTEIDSTCSFSTDCGSLSLDDTRLEDFSVFPVPTENILHVNTSQKIISIEVYSKLGELVQKNSLENSIDITTLSNGFYLVKVITENGYFGIKKILKK